ncbi:hypothetical protein A0H81_03144 [Grifola frondosa]|uniref:Uncharacterized protein n=1 Tax=Grifola frondosa TaxID=5627 RepID=A0A1C7MHY1_GRIFR|nr:hypothetical protein A0H81_03144 [Grifola frondosa]
MRLDERTFERPKYRYLDLSNCRRRAAPRCRISVNCTSSNSILDQNRLAQRSHVCSTVRNKFTALSNPQRPKVVFKSKAYCRYFINKSDPASLSFQPFRILRANSNNFLVSLWYSKMLHTSLVALLSFITLLGAVLVGGVPHARRQVGDLQCNINRAEIVFNLAQMEATVSNLTMQLASNSTAAELIGVAADGVSGAQGAVKTILLALINGETAPAEARDEVGGNLTSVFFALGNITSTDPETSANLEKAQTELTNAGLAGNGVVNNCKYIEASLKLGPQRYEVCGRQSRLNEAN